LFLKKIPACGIVVEEDAMRRSEINAIIRDMDTFIKQQGFYLPPFAYWTPEEWKEKGEEAGEIVERQLGWDITDFGLGNYRKMGLFLFTIRNGSPEDLQTGQGKLYAEKILIADMDQANPMHFHWKKAEDIINRGGGKLAIQVYNSTENGDLADTEVRISTDGVERVVKPGAAIILGRGESITLPSGLYHKFWSVESRVLIGEVSTVNDDNTDNRFHKPMGRFPEIEEDEPPGHLLCTDYPKYYNPR
jgi:D-lyxose ketol-isomerase